MPAATLGDAIAEIMLKIGSYQTGTGGKALDSKVREQLQTLHETLSRIRNDAVKVEKNQPQNNPDVRSWLGALQDAIMDLNDLVSHLSAYAAKHQESSNYYETELAKQSMTSRISSYIFTRNRLKVKHLIKKIEEELQVLKGKSETLKFPNETKRGRDLNKYEIIEAIELREEEKMEIIDRLILLQKGSFLDVVPAIAIVGIEGIGKSKLAKLIIKNETVKSHFDLLIWVDDPFDVNNVVKRIIESTGETKLEVESEADQIQSLRQAISKRRYLVVLDDLRNEDRDQWDRLQRMLVGAGASGGALIVTTRSSIVAKITSSTATYVLKELNENDSRSLFQKIACFDEQGQSELTSSDSRILDMGSKLMDKYRGIPLAITILVDLLRSLAQECTEIELAQSEGEVLEDLKWRYYNELQFKYYDDLSLHAKECFAYCSLFSKNYLIDVQRLIDLWMGEGFLETAKTGASPEDVGHNYFEEFLRRSIFQEVKDDEFGMAKTCKMQHLMHDLATFVGGEENVSMNQDAYGVCDGLHLHRVSFDFSLEMSFGIPKSLIKKAERLRTILLPAPTQSRLPHEEKLTRFGCDAIFSRFKNLRLLDLHDLGIKALPSSIVELKNLKYLDLSKNNMEKLPSSITKLEHLQTLKLSHCHVLKELPKELQDLANLKHLVIDGCLDLTHMPRGIRKLTSLQTLSYFVTSKHHSSSSSGHIGGFEELSDLNNLRGDLEILHLERLKSNASQVKSYLNEKPHLRCLTLRWDRDEDNRSGREANVVISYLNEENALEQHLKPNQNLRGLSIVGYRGEKIFSWLSSLESLVKFSLYNCPKCKFLPRLDQLPLLKVLELQRLDSLEFVAEDNGGIHMESTPPSSSTTPKQFFPSLKELTLSSCRNLKSWWKTGGVVDASFPCISRLHIRYCPELASIPLFPNLDERLELVSCRVEPLRKTIMLEANTMASQSSPPLSRLKSMLVEKIVARSPPTEWLKNFTSLKELHIRDCPNLKYFPKGFNCLCSLEHLTVENCPKLVMSSDEWSGLRNLHTLIIREIPELRSLPEGLEYVTSIQHLELHGCSRLECLSNNIDKLTSLKSLVISECFVLASLPQQMRELKLLKKLTIQDCPRLLPRCQPETGDDWPYIKHIKQLNISVTQTSQDKVLRNKSVPLFG